MHNTIKTVYLNILTELVKEESPTMYLEDFLYYYNKAISDYMKLRYEKFEMSQQLTDDMRVWKVRHKTDKLVTKISELGACDSADCPELIKCNSGCPSQCVFDEYTPSEECIKKCEGDPDLDCTTKCMNDLRDKCVESCMKKCKESIKKPYRHLLGCILEVELKRPVLHCEQLPGTVKGYKATRSTSDRNTGLVDNVYFEPRFYRPYFDIVGDEITIYVGDIDESKIKISTITIEYLRQPVYVTLTEDEILAENDTSQVLEFPRDIEEEITKIMMANLLERGGSQRLSTNPTVTKTVNDIGLSMK